MAHDVENICIDTIPIDPAVTDHTASGDDDTDQEITLAEIVHANVRDRHNDEREEHRQLHAPLDDHDRIQPSMNDQGAIPNYGIKGAIPNYDQGAIPNYDQERER